MSHVTLNKRFGHYYDYELSWNLGTEYGNKYICICEYITYYVTVF